MARKRFVYERKEIVSLGYDSMDDMPEDVRKNLQALIDRNMTPNERSKTIAAKVICKQQTNDSKHEDGEEGGGGISGNSLFDKSKCCDVFNDVIVDDLNMYEQRSDRVKLQMKFKRMTMSHELTKVKFMLGVGGLMDIFYLLSVLKKI